jgi:hypothetical protein
MPHAAPSEEFDFGLSTALAEDERKSQVEAIVERGRRAARAIASQRQYTRVFTGGAPLAGLGSPRSDIDIFVVLDDKSSGSDEQTEFEGQRVDIEYLTLAELAQRVASAVPFRATAAEPAQLGRASRSWLDTLTRFLLGEIMVDDGNLEALHGKLTNQSSDYTRLVIARHAQDFQNRAEDVDGALLNGDLFGADYQSREMVYLAAEAALCAQGDLYINTKWLAARWERTMRGSVLEPVGEFIADLSLPDRRQAVRRNIWLAQDLFVQAATGYRYTLTTDFPDAWPIPPGVVWRDPKLSILPFSDGIVVRRDFGRGMRLSSEGMLLWALAHGRDRESAVTETAKHLEAAGHYVSTPEIDEYYGNLLRAGLMMGQSDDHL